MPASKRFSANRNYQNSLGLQRGYVVPNTVKDVNNKLARLGFAPMSYRSTMLLGNLAKSGLYDSTCVCHWMARNGVTQSSGAVSSWLNVAPSNVALNKSLQQTTAANMPTLLMHDGGLAGQYGYTNGVSGNYFSTPDSAAVSITGDLDLRAQIALADWTPATNNRIISKFGTGVTRSYCLMVTTTGALRASLSSDGSTLNADHTSSATTSFTDGSSGWIRMTFLRDNGAGQYVVTFYTSTDGVNWVQLGTTFSGASFSISDNASVLEIGSSDTGTFNVMIGKVSRAQVYSGINGTLAFDFNPATYVSGTTFTDSSVNAATITIQGGATVVTISCLYFDGTNDYLKTGAFTLNQPTTVYWVGQTVASGGTTTHFDGFATNGMAAGTNSGATFWQVFAGSSITANGYSAKATRVTTSVYRGTSSESRINRNASTVGNAGTNNGGGFTLGTVGNALSQFSNQMCSEVLVYNTTHTTTQQDVVINYLMTKYNL